MSEFIVNDDDDDKDSDDKINDILEAKLAKLYTIDMRQAIIITMDSAVQRSDVVALC